MVALVGACGDNVPAAVDAPRDTSVPVDAAVDAMPTARLRVTPSSAVFGPTASNATSAAISVVVTNDGDAPSGVIAKQIVGADAATFLIASDSCTTSLAPLASCTIELTFRSATGSRAASLAVSATPGGAVTAALSGTALGEQFLTVTPSPHDYGAVDAGQTRTQAFTILNAGAFPAALSIQITGADATQFGVTGADTCTGATLPGGSACTITVAFSPTTVGGKTGMVTVSQPAGASASVALVGTAVSGHGPVISPTPFNYGDVVVGQSSTQTFTITNPGGSAMTLTTALLDGPDPTHFLVGSDSCSGATVAPGASCTFAVAFSPSTTGTKAATASVATGVASSTVALSGTGTL